MNCIILDDEYKSRESLSLLIEKIGVLKIVALCSTVDEALAAIQIHNPDILFLDIMLRGENGFDLLSKIKEQKLNIIFTTAFSDYALKAIKFSAIDYLLKPIDINELKEAISKVESRTVSLLSNQLKGLIDNLQQPNGNKLKLALPTLDGLVFVKVADIVCCVAERNYTKIYCENGKNYMVSKTLKDYDDMLTDHGFIRIHHSSLINTFYAKKYIKGDGGQFIMSNDMSLDVSKRRKSFVLEHFSKNLPNTRLIK